METDQVCNEYLPIIYLSAKEGDELKLWTFFEVKIWLFTCILAETYNGESAILDFKYKQHWMKVKVAILLEKFLNHPGKKRREYME